MAHEYLRHLVPPTIQSTTIYPLRNGDNLIVPFCKLSITNSSFIPSTIKEWNKLDIAIRKLDSLPKFKNAIRLNSQSNKISVPKLYYYGPRKLNVILTQIRCTASFLNHDLHKVHILSSPVCSCGALQEDAKHFFFVCTKYSEIRNDLFLSISDLSQLINTSLLTSGSETLSYADNCFIFYSVFRFMKRSKRFLIYIKHVLTKHHPASKYTHTHTCSSFLFTRLLFSAILYDKIVFFLFSCPFSI